jgi:hypothetical protein
MGRTRAAFVATALLLGLVAPATAVQSSTGGTLVAEGMVVHGNGRGARASVVAMAWPNEAYLRTVEVGDAIETPLVGSTNAGRSGAWSLTIDADAVPGTHRCLDGGLNLMLFATDGRKEGRAFAPIRAVALVASADGNVASASRSLDGEAAVIRLTDLAATPGSGELEPMAAPAPIYRCSAWTLQSSTDVWVTMGQSYSGPATNFAQLDSSHSVTSGTAISASGSAGSWSSSGSMTHTVGLTKTWAESLADRTFQSEVRYGRWKTICAGIYPKYAFTPNYGTGGDRTVAATSYHGLNHCTSISAGLWQRRTSGAQAYTESVGVKAKLAIGIDLAITNDYSSTESRMFTLSYRAPRTLRICGDNDVPARASKPRIPAQ